MKVLIFFAVALMNFMCPLSAQICDGVPFKSNENPFKTGDFDYIHVKTTALTQGIGETIDKYVATRNFIVNKIVAAMNGSVGTKTYILNNQFIIEKLNYAKPFTLGGTTAQPFMVLIRPNTIGANGELQELPCVLATNGNPSYTRQANKSQIYLPVADLVLRGYAVAFYENIASCDVFCSTLCDSVKNNDSNNINLCDQGNALNCNASPYNDPKTLASETVQQFEYLGFQYATAAAKFVVSQKNTLKLNTSQLFAFGGSYGAFCTLSLAYSDSNNFNDPIFACLGDKNARVLSSININTIFDLKSISVLSGGLPGVNLDGNKLNDSKMGEFIDASDKNTPILMIHGRIDPAVPVNKGWFLGDSINSPLWYEGPITLISKFNQFKIRNWVFVNCHAGHSTLVESTNNKYIAWQLLDYGTAIGHFFKLRIDEGSASPDFCTISKYVRTNNCILSNATCSCTALGTTTTGRIIDYKCNCGTDISNDLEMNPDIDTIWTCLPDRKLLAKIGSKISINTGVDTMLTVIPFGQLEPRWTLTDSLLPPLQTLDRVNYSPIVSQWIGFDKNEGTPETNYQVQFDFCTDTCGVYRLNFRLMADNSACIYLDNILIPSSLWLGQIPIDDCANVSADPDDHSHFIPSEGYLVDHLLAFASGIHTLKVDVFNEGNSLSSIDLFGSIELVEIKDCNITTSVINYVPDNIKIYPNPTNGNVFIKNLTPLIQKCTLSDALGRNIYSFEIPENENQMEVNLNDLKPGIYFMVFIDKQGHKITQKMIKH